jgi:replicative DNA helicase
MADNQDYMNNLIDQGSFDNNEVEAEMALLALCMRKDTAILGTVENRIEEGDFTDVRNRIIFNVISDMFLENKKIDRITVYAEIDRRGLSDKAGGQRYVYRVGDQTAVSSAFNGYIDAIKERSSRTKLLNAVEDIRKKTLSGGLRSNEAVDYAIGEISRLRGVGETKGFEGMPDILKLTMNEITSELKDDSSGGKVKLGYPRLDSMLGGLRPGSLNILAARPSMGKSALAINMAANVASYQNPVAIFSLEMSSDLLVRRLIACEACVDLTKISTGQLSDSERMKVASAISTVANTKIFIDDSPGLKLTDIVAKAKKLQAANPDLGMVIIDYLGLIQLTSKGKGADSRQEEVRKITLALKDLSRELKVPVIVLSQLSRDVEKRDSKRPMLSDLRDSGSIEQDADIVMLLYREDYYDKTSKKGQNLAGGNKTPANMSGDERLQMSQAQKTEAQLADIPASASYVEVNVAKNRNGQTGKAALFFYKAYGRFDKPSQEWEENMNAITAETFD